MARLSEKPKAPVGYTDTPMLPDSKWRVHDPDRPQPKVVQPGICSSPPSDAIVLFDGQDTSQWIGRDGGPIRWKVEDGALETPHGVGNIETREHFGDCQLHIEWATPAEVDGDSQGRGNSGVFLMGKYEIQVLDSYNNRTYADGHAGAIYGQFPPLVNASRGPGEWQTYDIFFVAPHFDGDRLVSPAYITVVHNGVLVHHCQASLGPTDHRIFPTYNEPHGPKGPLMLQDHRNPVRYRNIWIRPLKGYDEA